VLAIEKAWTVARPHAVGEADFVSSRLAVEWKAQLDAECVAYLLSSPSEITELCGVRNFLPLGT
jgi:hypothetical protein